MIFKARINSAKLRQQLLKLSNLNGDPNSKLSQGLEIAAEFVVSRASNKAPRGFSSPGLASSDFVGDAKVKGKTSSVEFGFNKPHAQVMNKGFRKSVIKPIKAKRLFIPISRRGARTGPTRGAVRALVGSTTKGGLVYGQDFVLVKRVKTPKAVKGRKKGPNFYFDTALEGAQKSGAIAKQILGPINKEIARLSS